MAVLSFEVNIAFHRRAAYLTQGQPKSTESFGLASCLQPAPWISQSAQLYDILSVLHCHHPPPGHFLYINKCWDRDSLRSLSPDLHGVPGYLFDRWGNWGIESMMGVQLPRGRDAVWSPACLTVSNDMPEVWWESKIPVLSTFYLLVFLPIRWSSLHVESNWRVLRKGVEFRAWPEF